MCSTLGIHHAVTTPNHPQSNGLVERFHRQLKEGLRSRAAGVAWLEHLPWVLLGIRAAPNDPAGALPPAADTSAIPLRQQSYAEVLRAGSEHSS